MPDNRTIPTCTGECCREFPIGGESLLSIRQIVSKEGPGGDMHKVASMLIPTGHFSPWGNQMFTCMHWDAQTKRCGIYAVRPRMCWDFPYEGKCRICQGGKI